MVVTQRQKRSVPFPNIFGILRLPKIERNTLCAVFKEVVLCLSRYRGGNTLRAVCEEVRVIVIVKKKKKIKALCAVSRDVRCVVVVRERPTQFALCSHMLGI